jgi:hypothetical protein
MTKDEALKLSLECIEAWSRGCSHDDYWRDIEETLTAIKEALAQPPLTVQEPVGSVVRWLDGSLVHGWFSNAPPEGTLLYITPPAPLPVQPEERNFCQRCGKRTADLTTIHTCTPPRENT